MAGWEKPGEILRSKKVNRKDAGDGTWSWTTTSLSRSQSPLKKPISISRTRHTNHFGTAVRVISDDVYERILSLAGSRQARRDRITVRALPPLESLAVESKDVEDVFQTTKVRGTTSDKTRSTPRRRAKDSKIVGDRAEAIVYNALCKSYTEVRWLARDNVTPGWDIEYEDGRRLVRVEVKGSKGSTIQSIDITAKEWSAAEKHGVDYHLYVVTDALSGRPCISVIEDPAQAARTGVLSIRPLSYLITRS